MKLETVTITGADDSTDIVELAELSEEFPFVEWGILISARARKADFAFPQRNGSTHSAKLLRPAN
ncbi:MAG: hypothetical protein ACYCSP_12405 [Acidobacteriaceae bacterium]